MKLGDTAKYIIKRPNTKPINCRVEIIGVKGDTKIGMSGIRKGAVQVKITESEPFWIEADSLTTY
jgi:hypothetical protein